MEFDEKKRIESRFSAIEQNLFVFLSDEAKQTVHQYNQVNLLLFLACTIFMTY